MDDEKRNKKNHWTQSKVDNATKKINQEVYKRNRQAPIQIKLDDMAILINDKITRRGIAKGLVFIQEDLNKNILEAEKGTMKILTINNPVKQYEILSDVQSIIKIEVWTDIRFLMINKAITPRGNNRINKKRSRNRQRYRKMEIRNRKSYIRRKVRLASFYYINERNLI